LVVTLQGEGIVEARVEALVENLAMAVMQANNLAADLPEYEALAETLAYALDLADLGLSAESNAFDALEPPKVS
jgi:heme oxygenase